MFPMFHYASLPLRYLELLTSLLHCHIVFIFKRCVIVIRKNPTFSLQKTYIKKKKTFYKTFREKNC